MLLSWACLLLLNTWTVEQSHTCQLFDLESDTEEFKIVEEMVHDSMPAAEVTSVQKIQNLLQYQKYYLEKLHVAAMNDLPNPDDLPLGFEKLLFHGTRRIPPAHIISSQEGFDVRLSATQNLWGSGAYFSESASYTHAFAHSSSLNPGVSQILIASVLVGESFDYGKMCNTSLRQAPLRISHRQLGSTTELLKRFDSVSGETKNSKVYAVYSSSKACPRYLVKYKLPDTLKLEDVEYVTTSQISMENS